MRSPFFRSYSILVLMLGSFLLIPSVAVADSEDDIREDELREDRQREDIRHDEQQQDIRQEDAQRHELQLEERQRDYDTRRIRQEEYRPRIVIH